MKKTKLAVASALVVAALLAGCTGGPSTGETSTSPPSRTASASPSAEATVSPSRSGSPVTEASVEGTVVRFTAGDASVDVTIDEDSTAARDFVSMLPMILELEEFNGREKIADLPRELDYEGSPGSDPEDGDLIYFVPWGNIGFYYNTDGIGFSDQTIHLGTYDATEADLARFEDRVARVGVVR